MKVHQLIAPNQSDIAATEMRLPNFFEVKDIGASESVRREKVTVRDTKTGTIYGRRTIQQKST